MTLEYPLRDVPDDFGYILGSPDEDDLTASNALRAWVLAQEALARRMRRWRITAFAIGAIQMLFNQSKERVWAPGGQGYALAAANFEAAANVE